jgi:DNA-binding MarR family transcriptional regulator
MTSQDRARTADELATTVALLSRRMRAASAEDSLTPSQVSVMARLATGGPATTADLARDELVRPQSMRLTLSVLEERGLISRAPHSTDGRQVVFSLTDEGVEVRSQARRARRGWLTRAMENELTEDEAQALADVLPLLRRLVRS